MGEVRALAGAGGRLRDVQAQRGQITPGFTLQSRRIMRIGHPASYAASQ